MVLSKRCKKKERKNVETNDFCNDWEIKRSMLCLLFRDKILIFKKKDRFHTFGSFQFQIWTYSIISICYDCTGQAAIWDDRGLSGASIPSTGKSVPWTNAVVSRINISLGTAPTREVST